MSFMLFDQREHSALIVTDTLASNTKLEPLAFSSKVIPLPHMNLALTGTGSTELVRHWSDFISIAVTGARDIEDLAEIAPEQLRAIWARLTPALPPGTESRICHIGFPAGSDRIVRYAFESPHNFEPEVFEEPEMWMQPLNKTFAIEHLPATANDYIQLVTRLKDENDQAMVPNPIGIGGEIHATVVENWSIQTVRWHRFPDYESTRTAMMQQAARDLDESAHR